MSLAHPQRCEDSQLLRVARSSTVDLVAIVDRRPMHRYVHVPTLDGDEPVRAAGQVEPGTTERPVLVDRPLPVVRHQGLEPRTR